MLVIQKLETRGWKTIVRKKTYEPTFEDAIDEIVSIAVCSTPFTYRIAIEKEINYGYEQFPRYTAKTETVSPNRINVIVSDKQGNTETRRVQVTGRAGEAKVLKAVA